MGRPCGWEAKREEEIGLAGQSEFMHGEGHTRQNLAAACGLCRGRLVRGAGEREHNSGRQGHKRIRQQRSALLVVLSVVVRAGRGGVQRGAEGRASRTGVKGIAAGPTIGQQEQMRVRGGRQQ